MRKSTVVCVLLSILVFSGCQTLGRKFTDEHTKVHNVEVQVDQKLGKYVKSIDLSHRLYDGKSYLSLSGSLQKPFGSFSSSIKVNATFYDDNGQVVAESNDRVLFSRMGSRTHRRYKGSLFLKIEDNPAIKKCILELTV
ncbi:MAG: hypothetical protein JNN05_07320 [Candidatus Omnitrophica bacterium]|nr:hypothetical protein [Candidatus Omnitrophota bacterium]